MRGEVSQQLEPCVALSVYGEGDSIALSAMVDTGFNGYLTLPTAVVRKLQLRIHSVAPVELADGSIVAMQKYRVGIRWNNTHRVVLALQTEGEALIGMSMLRGHVLTIHAAPGGEVRIIPDPLPPSRTTPSPPPSPTSP